MVFLLTFPFSLSLSLPSFLPSFLLQKETNTLNTFILCLVCRLLEQEKTAHRELKQTWQMANDQFLENQLMQNDKMTLMWSIMTKEQKQKVKEERQKLVTKRPKTGELVDLTTPPLTPDSSVEVGDTCILIYL